MGEAVFGHRCVCPEERCGQSFSRPYKLRIHMMTHTGERPFKVSSLGAFFYKMQKHILKLGLDLKPSKPMNVVPSGDISSSKHTLMDEL